MAIIATYISHLEEFNSWVKAHLNFQFPETKNASISVLNHKQTISWLTVSQGPFSHCERAWNRAPLRAQGRMEGQFEQCTGQNLRTRTEGASVGSEHTTIYPLNILPSLLPSALTSLLAC